MLSNCLTAVKDGQYVAIQLDSVNDQGLIQADMEVGGPTLGAPNMGAQIQRLFKHIWTFLLLEGQIYNTRNN